MSYVECVYTLPVALLERSEGLFLDDVKWEQRGCDPPPGWDWEMSEDEAHFLRRLYRWRRGDKNSVGGPSHVVGGAGGARVLQEEEAKNKPSHDANNPPPAVTNPSVAPHPGAGHTPTQIPAVARLDNLPGEGLLRWAKPPEPVLLAPEQRTQSPPRSWLFYAGLRLAMIGALSSGFVGGLAVFALQNPAAGFPLATVLCLVVYIGTVVEALWAYPGKLLLSEAVCLGGLQDLLCKYADMKPSVRVTLLCSPIQQASGRQRDKQMVTNSATWDYAGAVDVSSPNAEELLTMVRNRLTTCKMVPLSLSLEWEFGDEMSRIAMLREIHQLVQVVDRRMERLVLQRIDFKATMLYTKVVFLVGAEDIIPPIWLAIRWLYRITVLLSVSWLLRLVMIIIYPQLYTPTAYTFRKELYKSEEAAIANGAMVSSVPGEKRLLLEV